MPIRVMPAVLAARKKVPSFPIGVIAMWSGLLANIPANWHLCDGSGGTPNLIARFVRGAPAGTNPGITGGVDSHGHASMTSAGGHTHSFSGGGHSHTVNAAGSHNHGWNGGSAAPGGTSASNSSNAGSHQHTTNTDSHTHTVDSQGAHTHTINTADGRPPYYEVAFIQAGAGAAVAANIIVIWTGTIASIPAGWSLCDGGSGRPDLRTRFVRGVNSSVTNPGATGGATTHVHTEVATSHSHTSTSTTHSHTHNAYTWTHSHCEGMGPGASEVVAMYCASYSGSHTHSSTDAIANHNHNPMGTSSIHDAAHTVNSASSLPAYYDVAYIINDGGATTIPVSGVLIWTDTLANIPSGWNLCDGGGGRPDLRARFIRGSAAGVDPGGTGGSDTHTHTDVSVADHNDHSQTAGGGNHTHAATDTIGGHGPHSGGGFLTDNQYPYPAPMGSDTGGDHSHSYNSEGGTHTHTLSSAGSHNHNPWSTDDGRPAYYEVAFIQKA